MSFNNQAITKILSMVILTVGLALTIPALFAFFVYEHEEFKIFLGLSVFITSMGFFSINMVKPVDTFLKVRDSYLTVALCWLTFALLGALPYFLTGITSSFIDAFFVSTASFTTTGATVLKLNTLPKSILLWQGICNWLGGLGLLVLVISVIPTLGIGGKNLAEAEVTSSASEKVSGKLADSMQHLYIIYITLTITEFILLTLGPMNSFDALLNTLSSISTSGLPSMYHPLSHYNSPYTEVIIAIFSLISALNFALFYVFLQGDFKAFARNIEFKFFMLWIAICASLISGNLYFSHTYDLYHSIRYGIFQTISMASTAGFTISGHLNWPAFSLVILSALMFVGGCAFSTSGGIKISRLLVFLKLIERGYQKRLHPRSVVAIKIGRKPITAKKVSMLTIFILLYAMFIIIGALILSLDGHNLSTTLSSSISMLSNIGVGLDKVSGGDFSIYSPPMRLVLCILMLAGRLELFTFLALFMPSFWYPSKYKDI
ncbi:MAG: TrkH family potassium uptake protein [Eubacteriales bacterium]